MELFIKKANGKKYFLSWTDREGIHLQEQNSVLPAFPVSVYNFMRQYKIFDEEFDDFKRKYHSIPDVLVKIADDKLPDDVFKINGDFTNDFELFIQYPWKELYMDTLLLDGMKTSAQWGVKWQLIKSNAAFIALLSDNISECEEWIKLGIKSHNDISYLKYEVEVLSNLLKKINL